MFQANTTPKASETYYRVIGIMLDGERISVSKYASRKMAERIAARPEHRSRFRELLIVPEKPWTV
jgi:hypothetical protein